MKTAIHAAFLTVALCLSVLAQQSQAQEAPRYRCMSYVHTARPGQSQNFSYGPAMDSLEAAQAEALHRCKSSGTSYALLCSTHCVTE